MKKRHMDRDEIIGNIHNIAMEVRRSGGALEVPGIKPYVDKILTAFDALRENLDYRRQCAVEWHETAIRRSKRLALAEALAEAVCHLVLPDINAIGSGVKVRAALAAFLAEKGKVR